MIIIFFTFLFSFSTVVYRSRFLFYKEENGRLKTAVKNLEEDNEIHRERVRMAEYTIERMKENSIFSNEYKWSDVNEKLPPDSEPVLAVIIENINLLSGENKITWTVGVKKFNSNYGWSYLEREQKVSYWMPLVPIPEMK